MGPSDDDRPAAHGSAAVGAPAPRRRARLAGALLLVLALLVAAVFALRPGADPGPGPGAGGAPGAGPSPAPVAAADALRIVPGGAGKRTGRGWADAGDLDDLPDLVSRLPDGGEVWLRADAGPYELDGSVALDSGGAPGQPVVVRGVDAAGRPSPARLVSDRASPYNVDGKVGSEAFEMVTGAEHLTFRDLSFTDVGSAFAVSGNATGIEVSDVTAKNVRRFFDNTKDGDEQSATISGLVLRRIKVSGYSKGAVRLRYDTHDVLVEDVVGDSEMQDGDDFAMGVALQGNVRGVVLRRVRMDNSRDTLRKYWNGDGFATEEDVDDVLFEQTSASGSTDAGYDLKSTNTRLVGAVARGNKRNYRFWATDTVVQDSSGQAPAKRGGNGGAAQVWLADGAAVTLTGCTLTDSGPLVFEVSEGAALRMQGGRITRPAAGELQKVAPGGRVQLTGVAQR